ncbi:DUF4253 domain-containing protein [Streptomyces sp. NPDC002680]|uniref:DUF4253 domain-containing protein n=1 Tax=Streptomyces sp. NPDC002680 TaxID=3364659 RepID=UPI00369AE8EB
MSEPLQEHHERLPEDLPPGRLVGPSQDPHPLVWLSDGPVRGAADWWARLYSRHSETGLYPLLLEYPDDSFEPVGVGGDYAAGADAAYCLRREWTKDAWPPFEEWPGLAAPASVATDVALPAGELATALVRSSRAQCLALVEVSRGADAPAALNWAGPANHITAQELSAVLRSWEDRFGVRVVGFGHGSLHVSVAAPPTDIDQARVLTAEHYVTCPDWFYVEPSMDWETYPEELMKRHEWEFWWD